MNIKQRKKLVIGILILMITISFVGVIVNCFFTKDDKEEIFKNGYKKTTADMAFENGVIIKEEFLTVNPYSRPGTHIKEINNIVVHYVANPGSGAEDNRSYFEGLSQTGETYASSHYIIGLEGEIIQCVPLNEVAYCSNDRNDDTISIEVCHPESDGEFTDDSYNSLVMLCAWLCDAYKLKSSDIIRHYDITGKICPKYFVDYPDKWEDFKNDVKEMTDRF